MRNQSYRSCHLPDLPLWIPVRTLLNIKEHSGKRSCKNQFNKKIIIFISCCFHIKSIYGPYMGHPRSRNWTLDFEPAFSPRFSFPLSPRSFFPTGQQFLPILSPRSIFFHWSAVSHLKSRDFRFPEPAILFGPLVSGFPSHFR